MFFLFKKKGVTYCNGIYVFGIMYGTFMVSFLFRLVATVTIVKRNDAHHSGP